LNRKLWFCLIIIIALVLAGCSKGDNNELEEAAEIYSIEANSPTQIGTLVKVSEAELTEGAEEMGAVEGKLLEYASDTEYVLVMAFRFSSPDLAGQAFQKLEVTNEIIPNLYEMETDFYCALVSDFIYLASGPRDSVITVINGISHESS